MSKVHESGSVNDKRTQVRFYCPVLLEQAIERYMKKKGVKKGEAIEEFLMGSETLQKEMEEIRKFYDY